MDGHETQIAPGASAQAPGDRSRDPAPPEAQAAVTGTPTSDAPPDPPTDQDTNSPTRQKILAAAETVFSDAGFEAAGMKAIALRAEVSQALLHYHFGSKDRLYAEVIRARSKMINDSRRRRLDAVRFGAGDPLPAILEALIRPTLAPEGGGKAYARIFAGMIAGRAHDRDLVRECYDPTARLFLDAIERARPGIDRPTAALIYQFALGLLVSVIARDGRMERLMGREGALLDEDALIRNIVDFAVGGADTLTGQPPNMETKREDLT